MNDQTYNAVDRILVPHTAFTKATNKILQCMKAVESTADPICIALVGESRAGKTRILEHIESLYPRGRTTEGAHIPILRMTVPAKPTIKGLAEEILRSLGDPRPDKGSASNMTSRIASLICAVKTQAIIVDEFQHFYDKDKRKVMHTVADWFKVLVDRCGIVLVTSGLESSQSVLNLNEQLAGRFMTPICIPRFDWENDQLREEFIAILGAFQAGLPGFDLPKLDSDEIAFRFYCASGGLIGYVVKILRQAVWNAVDSKLYQVGLDDFAQAYMEAVYRDVKLLKLPNPFTRGFTLQASEDLLTRVRQIGTPLVEKPKPRESKPKKTKPSAGDVLHA